LLRHPVGYLEDLPDLTQPITVVRSDVLRASTTYLRANDELTAEELLHLGHLFVVARHNIQLYDYLKREYRPNWTLNG